MKLLFKRPMKLLFKRPDGTYVALVNGNPYQVIPEDDLFAEAQKDAEAMGDALEFEPIPEPLSPAIPTSITRRQCAKQMHAMNLIKSDEMRMMTTIAQPPKLVTDLISGLPQEQQDMILTDFAATDYYRDNALLEQLMTQAGYDSKAVDQFFIDASSQ